MFKMSSQRRARPNGFTLIELLVVIAIIAILAAILFPVFARARSRARQTACLSNMKQIALATRMYAQDFDNEIFNGYWSWPVQLLPYTKNSQIFVCPESSAPAPESRTYNAVALENGAIFTGTTLSNDPGLVLYPRIWGNYAYNNELYNIDAYRAISVWVRPAEEIMFTESRAGSEDNDTNDFDDDNAPYNDPGGTTWNQVFAQYSARHNNGHNVAFADGHVKWKSYDWLISMDGKRAFHPDNANKSNTSGF